jgi:hypothetical protein
MVLFAAVEWIDLLFLCLTSLKWEGSYLLKPIIFAKCLKKTFRTICGHSQETFANKKIMANE